LAGELAPVLFEKLDGNPRRLKRFLNAFWVRSDIAARRGVALEPRTLAKLMVLERIEEDAFGQLLDWLGAGTLSENLRKLEIFAVGDLFRPAVSARSVRERTPGLVARVDNEDGVFMRAQWSQP
jgi:hypothetical protein